MRRLTLVAFTLAVVAGSSFATPLIGRNGNIGKPFQVFAWANFGYNQTAVKYDWLSSAWTSDGVVPLKTTSCDVTVGLGLPFKLELDVVAPLAMKSYSAADSSQSLIGLGDVMVYARYGLLQSSLLPVKAALILGANLPTADTTPWKVVRLGDKTVDLAFGVSANTQKYFGFLGHVRAAYWLNGKKEVLTDASYQIGNSIEYNLTLDYSINKALTPELALTGNSKAKDKLDGMEVPYSETSQHVVNVLLMWKPISMLTIRPKVAFPLTFMSKGGSMANVYGGLDVWATFP